MCQCSTFLAKELVKTLERYHKRSSNEVDDLMGSIFGDVGIPSVMAKAMPLLTRILLVRHWLMPAMNC